eukprot:5638963-Amphidinium_carterae.3
MDMTPEEQAGMERTFILGSINPVPQAPDMVTAHMRVDIAPVPLTFISFASFLLHQRARYRHHRLIVELVQPQPYLGLTPAILTRPKAVAYSTPASPNIRLAPETPLPIEEQLHFLVWPTWPEFHNPPCWLKTHAQQSG